ncbi:hypothetical protein [Clostridium chromiireducens]|nr:hypothetical protein [Clostridium chromiireducens]
MVIYKVYKNTELANNHSRDFHGRLENKSGSIYSKAIIRRRCLKIV